MVANASAKPVLTCWMGEDQVAEGRLVFRRTGIPYFKTPETAVEEFSYITAFYENQRLLMQTPGSLSQPGCAGLGTQAGEARLAGVLREAGFGRVRRAAETPLNLVLEARLA